MVDGGAALVFPILAKTLSLNYSAVEGKLGAEFLGDYSSDIHMLFWSVLEHGLELVQHSLSDISGHFTLENNIPIGSGMGASAALCVAVTRWLIWKNLIKGSELSHFAQRLENLFHSRSSGLDIAGTQYEHGLIFQQGEIQPLPLSWQPIWTLSFSGQIGITSHCVKKVQNLRQNNGKQAQKIYDKMLASVKQASQALAMPESKESLDKLAGAINTANQCFSDWDLAGGHVAQHINTLREAGAIAAKPTGSGDGGYVLSLWQSEPDCSELGIELLRV